MKRNLIKKLLIGGLITSLCIYCCFIKVNASSIDSNSDIFDDYFYFEPKEYNDIQTYNDLKGTIWHLNFDLYEYKEGWGDFTISLSFLQGNDVNHLFDLPFIIQLRNDFIRTEVGYELFPNANISICPLYNSNDGNSIIINCTAGEATTYIQYYSYYEAEFGDKVDIGVNKNVKIQSKYLFIDGSNNNRYLDVAISSSDNVRNDLYGSIETYLFFPNNNYTISDYTNIDTNFLSLLKNGSTMVNLSNSTHRRISTAFNDGYTDGYDRGFQAGVSEQSPYRFAFLTGIFNGVSDLLSIEIFPDIQLGYFIFVPLALGITGMIFWFWRKD